MREQRESLFDEVFAGSWWCKQRDFPPCDEWKGEIEKHLRFVRDKGWLRSIKCQLQSRNYDSFLSEIFAAYFIENTLRFEVTGWNPKMKQGRDVEFVINDRACGQIFCEVKSPGWQGQLTKAEIQTGRAKRAKYSKVGEERYVAPYQHIRQTIRKAYAKFAKSKQNLLVVTDNLFQPMPMDKLVTCGPNKMPMNICWALYNTNKELYGGLGCFKTKDYENLGGILFLNDRFLSKFFAWFESNANARRPLSRQFVARALKLNEERVKSAEHDYMRHNGTD